MKKIGSFFSCILLMLLSSCDSDNWAEQSSEIVVAGLKAEWSGLDTSDEILFTGDDIVWFDLKTKELRFKNDPFEKKSKGYTKILFKISGMDLFLADIVTAPVNGEYEDLVLYHNPENKKYYLYESYPEKIDTETVRLNREIRSENWGAFIYQLGREGRLKE